MRSMDFSFWEHLEELVVQPLSQRTVLACQFNDLLCDDTAPERTNGGNLCLSKQGSVINQLLIQFLNLKLETFLVNLVRLPFLGEFQ